MKGWWHINRTSGLQTKIWAELMMLPAFPMCDWNQTV